MARTKANARGHDYGAVIDAINSIRNRTRERISQMTVQQVAAAFAPEKGLRARLRSSRCTYVKQYANHSDRELRYCQRNADDYWFEGIVEEGSGCGSQDEQRRRRLSLIKSCSTNAENVDHIVANLSIQQLESIAFDHVQESLQRGETYSPPKRQRRY
tara:strand:- start:109 stop:582 length:474 start_codon:yes stop_codon:yes gene_type:complete